MSETTQTEFLDPESYLPHRKPMCVITRVVSVGEADVTTEADLDADGVFATHWRPDGELPEAFFLEVMAQTIGIWSHVHDELTVVPEGDRKADAGFCFRCAASGSSAASGEARALLSAPCRR